MQSRQVITFPREVLLVEIDRRCSMPDCAARVLIGLTKEEARSYTGFECERCGQWTVDRLSKKDIPEWWSIISEAASEPS